MSGFAVVLLYRHWESHFSNSTLRVKHTLKLYNIAFDLKIPCVVGVRRDSENEKYKLSFDLTNYLQSLSLQRAVSILSNIFKTTQRTLL